MNFKKKYIEVKFELIDEDRSPFVGAKCLYSILFVCEQSSIIQHHDHLHMQALDDDSLYPRISQPPRKLKGYELYTGELNISIHIL